MSELCNWVVEEEAKYSIYIWKIRREQQRDKGKIQTSLEVDPDVHHPILQSLTLLLSLKSNRVLKCVPYFVCMLLVETISAREQKV